MTSLQEVEIWKDVVGFEKYFSVSSLGRVLSKRTNRILKQHVRKDRRVTIATRIGGRRGNAYCFKVHRLVAEAFIANPENKPTVNHIDGNPTNNILENLEWATEREQVEHGVQNGLFVGTKGVDSYQAALTEDDVLYIRSVYKPYDKEFGARALANVFNVHHCVISRVARNKSYKNT